jgi:Terminase small subunit
MTTKGVPGNLSDNNGRRLAIPYDGSRPLKNSAHERYARFRAQALPRMVAFRKAGNVAKNDCNAAANSFRLDGKPGVRARIDYLTRQAEERLIEKRVRLEEQLWSMAEADIGDFFETVEAAKSDKNGDIATDKAGKMLTVKKQRPKLLSDLPPESRRLIEDVTVDRNGNLVPRLYSKVQANAELRKMLNIGGQREPGVSDASQLSDAELIAQLADQAKVLGIDIDLNFRFGQPPGVAGSPTSETDGGAAVPGDDGNVGQVINADQALPDYPGFDPTSAGSANSEAGARPARKPALPATWRDTRPAPQRPQPTKPKPL